MPVPYLDHPPAVISIDVGRQLLVDDFLIVARDRNTMAEIKRRLRTVWKIVDKGPVKWML